MQKTFTSLAAAAAACNTSLYCKESIKFGKDPTNKIYIHKLKLQTNTYIHTYSLIC
jgi:hypothetical protein